MDLYFSKRSYHELDEGKDFKKKESLNFLCVWNQNLFQVSCTYSFEMINALIIEKKGQ